MQSGLLLPSQLSLSFRTGKALNLSGFRETQASNPQPLDPEPEGNSQSVPCRFGLRVQHSSGAKASRVGLVSLFLKLIDPIFRPYIIPRSVIISLKCFMPFRRDLVENFLGPCSIWGTAWHPCPCVDP